MESRFFKIKMSGERDQGPQISPNHLNGANEGPVFSGSGEIKPKTGFTLVERILIEQDARNARAKRAAKP
jgi:hypothetical protein